MTTNLTTADACYLAETRYDPAEPAELRLFGPATLAGYLASNIEHEHYNGDGDQIVRLSRYQAGTLTPLTLHQTASEHGSDDWLYWHFEVCTAENIHGDGSHVAEVAFTVCIDGRA
jgi:hypothetical protein